MAPLFFIYIGNRGRTFFNCWLFHSSRLGLWDSSHFLPGSVGFLTFLAWVCGIPYIQAYAIEQAPVVDSKARFQNPI